MRKIHHTNPKLARPKPGPSIVERTRLLERLQSTLATHAGIWIASPAGAGKTTLISDYLQHHDYLYIWYQLDPDDSDPAVFFEYLGISASPFSKIGDPPLPHLTPEYTLGVSTFARRFFQSFYALFRERRFVVVLDNYQRLDSHSVVHELMAEAMQELPSNGRVIVASRASAPAVYARLQVNDSLASMHWDDVRFSRHECQTFLAAHGISDSAQIDALMERTRGWVAGMRLMVTDRSSTHAQSADVMPSEHQLLFNYFATELFSTRKAEDRAFLVRTALLPSMTVEMASRLTDRDAAEVDAIFAELHRNNYFIERLDDGEPLYRYHPLFREFLLSKCEAYVSSQALRQLQRLAASLLRDDGQIEAAARLLVDAQDWCDLSTLCIEHAPRLLAAGRNQTLSSWIERVPARLQTQSPWLQYWRAVSLSIFDHKRAREIFRATYDAFRVADDITGQYLVCASALETYFLAWDEYVSCCEWLERLNDLRARHPEYPSVEIEAKVNSGILSSLQWTDGGHQRFPGIVQRCHELVKTLEDPSQCIFLGSLLVWFEHIHGDMNQGQLVVDTIAARLDDQRASPASLIHWYCAYSAHILNFVDDGPAALAAITRAEEVAATSGIRVFDGIILSTAAHIQLAMNKDELAAQTIGKLARVLRPGRIIDHAYYYYVLGVQALARRDVLSAETNTRMSVKLTGEAGALTSQALAQLHLIFVLLAMKDLPRAREAVAALDRISQPIDSSLIKSNALSAHAIVAVAGGSETEQRRAISALLAFLRERRNVNHWGRSVGIHARIYTRALELGVETSFVRHLIRAKNIQAEAAATLPDAWPFSVKLYALDRFTVLLDDEPLKFSGKAQKKPMELLKGIIAFGGRDVDETKLADALWPFAEDAPQALATTVYRLRRLIGEEAITRQEGSLSLNPQRCWADVWTFERQLAQLDRACRARDVSQLAALTEPVLAIYGRGFLPGETEASWVLAARERWRNLLLRQVEAVAGILSEAKQHDAAIYYYRKALEIHPLTEAFYLGLMQSYVAAGRSIEALSTYEQYRQILGRHHGVIPSASMEALAHRIR